MTSAEPGAVLAIDVGSSRIRASLVDVADGTVLDTCAGGDLQIAGELDLDAVWAELIDVVAALDRRGARIRGMALAALLGVALVDDRGRPTHPALTWMDARASPEAAELAEILDPEQTARIGRHVGPELTSARLRWLGRHEPAALSGSRWALSIKDALVLRLTGAAVTDETHASYSGVFDVAARRWDGELLRAAGVDPLLLPPARPGLSTAGGLTPAAARALGLAGGLPCAVGGPDGTVGALGAGASVAGVTIDIAGTTDVIVHTLSEPFVDQRSSCIVNAHVVPGLWTAGGPTGLTGGAIEWIARLLGYAAVGDARAALDGVALGPRLGDAPTFLPGLGGARFPAWRPDERGTLCDLAPGHGPADVFGAAQLGVACVIGSGIDALRRVGADIDTVVIAGGAARTPATLQLRSDCWGVDVVTTASHEATTTGAAMLAATACGAFPDVACAGRAFVRHTGHRAPSAQRSALLSAACERWRRAQTHDTTTTDER